MDELCVDLELFEDKDEKEGDMRRGLPTVCHCDTYTGHGRCDPRRDLPTVCLCDIYAGHGSCDTRRDLPTVCLCDIYAGHAWWVMF